MKIVKNTTKVLQLEHGMGRLDSQLGISLGNIISIDDLNFIC